MPELRADPDLRRLAEAATPGPWRYGDVPYKPGATGSDDIGVGIAGLNDAPVVTAYNTHCCQFADDIIVSEADAAYIAALSPDRVLDRLAALEEALRLVGEWISGPLAAWVEQTPGTETIPEPPTALSGVVARALAGTPKP